MDDFCYAKEVMMRYHQINSFRYEWDIKEATGKSMKNALCMLCQQYANRHHLSG